ncbi:hypothetical protein ONS95_006957 [Cadophora gregata]|uniref:uncharacterized protein n=1 Tax=Cadophora gregata TaxID=51156 RepID=UPI0026DBB199|nr:uncharacterized protein ONS95_006957 [Cadophora gregata]KAK0101807.1 hypothetical protein ONS95_006957 [Cadophora gregata]
MSRHDTVLLVLLSSVKSFPTCIDGRLFSRRCTEAAAARVGSLDWACDEGSQAFLLLVYVLPISLSFRKPNSLKFKITNNGFGLLNMASTSENLEQSSSGITMTSKSHDQVSSTPSNSPTRKAGKFVTAVRKVYRPLGFQKGYNFPLCKSSPQQTIQMLTKSVIIFGGAMLGFTLARFSYLNIGGSSSSSFKNGSAPGEWYNYRSSHYRIGITLHLVTIIPAGFLAVFQFIPVIRHKLLLFHRLNGYLLLLLSLLGNIGALMIARRAFGGGLDVQSAVGLLAIITEVSLAMAYVNIKRLQIDQHRAWMLRAWFYFGVIITTRIIMILAALVISSQNNYSATRPCGEIAYIVSGSSDLENQPPDFTQRYPQCIPGSDTLPVALKASMTDGDAENVGVALGMGFGMALWLALFLHGVGVEVYLNLTPREGERLRMVSYERQLERGVKNPGSAGFVLERFGDAREWVPTREGVEK